jgi:hypothetical protein
MQPTLIGIAGLKRSGKDSAADFLVATFGYQKIAFADPVRSGIRATFGPYVARKYLYDDDYKNVVIPGVGSSFRKLMQTFGTEWGRNQISRSLWTDLAQLQITKAWSYMRDVVVSDVRFEDEATLIRDSGGTVLHLSRPNSGEPPDPHSSESGVRHKPGDIVVVNDQDLDVLRDRMKELHYGLGK